MSQSQIIVKNLGLQPYESIWQQMRAFTDNRDASTPDEIWILEHPPVFTQGQAGKAEHILNPGDIPIVQSDRGGQVTYHGPGQLIAYNLIDLKRRKLGVRHFVTAIENALIKLLANYGVTAKARCDAPGVYVNGAKIASIGLRVRRGCTYHGLSFNVDMDLSPFARINPCGMQNLPIVQLKDFLNTIKTIDVIKPLERALLAEICAHDVVELPL